MSKKEQQQQLLDELEQLLIDNPMPGNEIAKLIGIHPVTFSKIRQGKYSMGAMVYYRIKNYINRAKDKRKGK